MAVPIDKQQFSISDKRAVIERVDELADKLELSRSELYAIAIRKLLKDPAGVVAEIITEMMADRLNDRLNDKGGTQ